VEIAYFNGAFVPKEEVRISPDDRGFLLADGVYEVTPAYRGRLLRPDAHLERLARGLATLRIGYDPAPLAEVCERLLDANGLREEEGASVYLQVTRGVASRIHHFPSPLPAPTVYAYARRIEWWSPERWERGSRAVTVPAAG
jgi:D-alanine transaminase